MEKPSQLLDAITERGSHQLFFLDIEIKGEEKKGLDIDERNSEKKTLMQQLFL